MLLEEKFEFRQSSLTVHIGQHSLQKNAFVLEARSMPVLLAHVRRQIKRHSPKEFI